MDNDTLEYYVSELTDNLDLVDELPDNIVDELIIYLVNEIKRKEKLVNDTQN